ncbi:MAG: succinate dehydrogenase, cytochrome b556 subunit [Pseudomonadota bacterium]
MRYRIKLGFAAWLLMRATGLGLTLYLAAHVCVLSHLARGPEAFDRLVGWLEGPLAHALELLLVAAAVFHAANGLRVMAIDFAAAALYQRPLFWLVSAATVAFVALAMWGLWPGALPR